MMKQLNIKNQVMIAVSGVKNSGKTSLIEKLVHYLVEKNIKVSVIKHDGHDFEPDVPETDSFRIRKAGAKEVAVFSKGRCMVIKENSGDDELSLMGMFPEADIIIIEGFKNSVYPKIEVIRSEISNEPACDPASLLGIYTDLSEDSLPLSYEGIPVFSLNETKFLADAVCSLFKAGAHDDKLA